MGKTENVADELLNKKPSKTKIIAGILASLVVAIAAGGYHYWTNSPAYALKKVAESIQNRDSASFHAYVQVDKVLESAVDDIIGSTMREQSEDESELGAIGSALGAKMIEAFKPQIRAMAKTYIDDFFNSRNSDSKEIPTKSSTKKPNKFAKKFGNFSLEHAFKDIEYLKTNGNVCNVGLKFFDKDIEKDLLVDIKLEKTHQWQIVKITNLNSILNEIKVAKEKIVSDHNSGIKAQLKSFVSFSNSKKRNEQDKWGISQKIIISTKVKNISDKQIKKLTASAKILGPEGDIIGSLLVSANKIPNPNQDPAEFAWEKSINSFISKDLKMFKASPDSKIEFEVQEVRFGDGSTIKMAESIYEIKKNKDTEQKQTPPLSH